MDGTSQLGSSRAHIDESFGDILKHLNFAGMLWLEGNKGNVGIFLNSLYSIMTDKAHDGVLTLDAKSKYGLFTGGVSYQAYQSIQWSLLPFVGLRYTLNNNQLKASTPSVTVDASDNQNWIDPIVGMRAIYAYNKAWSLVIEGDIGGTNVTSDYSYNLQALASYQVQSIRINSKLYLGYRMLDQAYQTGSGRNRFVWNMRIAGPLVGIGFEF